MNIRKKLRGKPDLHTGALNDILFILLLFFLIVSTLANPNVVKVNNPKGKPDTKTKQNIVVSVDKDNKIYVNQKEVPENLLDTTLVEEVRKAKLVTDTPSVVFNGDSIASYGSFIKSMMSAKRAGAKVVATLKP